MDTQLVRLEPPYNVICSKRGKFGLHVATLIVIKERIKGLPDGVPLSDTVGVGSYPIVSGGFGLDGQVWMDTELKDCHLVCRQKESVSLTTLKRVMEYCGKYRSTDIIPGAFVMASVDFGMEMRLPKDEQGKTISDYTVRLEFETGEHGIRCMTYSSKESDFYFYEYYADDTADYTSVGLINKTDAIKRIAELRNTYLILFKSDGLRSITFTTKQRHYQDFVDEVNKYRLDV